MIFDTVVQLALNGICCKREDNGQLSDPCESCLDEDGELKVNPPPLSPLHPVLTGHASSLLPY